MKKILIADDETTLRFLLTETLKLSEHFSVFEAMDGEDALKKIDVIQPDLLILDVMMPKLTGYEVVEKLQPKEKKPKVIFLSAKSQNVDLEKAFSLGVEHYLTKPFSPMHLLEYVHKILD